MYRVRMLTVHCASPLTINHEMCRGFSVSEGIAVCSCSCHARAMTSSCTMPTMAVYLLTKAVACEAVITTLFDIAKDAYVYRSLVHWERTLRRYMWVSYDDAVLWRAIVRWTRGDVELGTHHTAVMALSNAERWAKLADFPRRHR